MRRKLGDTMVFAANCAVEMLEKRWLLHGGTDMHVDFAPARASVPSSYDADTGGVYGDRGNGDVFGWKSDNSAASVQADSSAASDQRYRTFQYINIGNNWEAAVENGDYTVH